MSVIISPNVVLSLTEPSLNGKPLIGWHNIVNYGNISASQEDNGFPAINLGNNSTASIWKAESFGVSLLTVSMEGSPQYIDYIGIARHNFSTIEAEISIDIVKGIGAESIVETIIQPFIPKDNSPIILRFSEVVASAVIVKINAPNDIASLGILYVGKMLTVAGGIYQEVIPIPYSVRTDVVTNRAESGDFLGRIITDRRLDVMYDFSYVEYDWFKSNMGPFVNVSMLAPFFFSWLPSKYPDEVMFGWLNSDIRPTAERFDNTVVVQFSMDMGGIVR